MIVAEELKNIRRIAIYDDQPDSRESLSEIVHDSGYIPVPIEEPYQSLEDCLAEIKEYDAALFDHRLSEGNFGNFRGAKVVADLYRENFPAFLVSAWTDGDPEDLQIHRQYLPCVIAKKDIETEHIKQGLEVCLGEFNGEFLPTRRATRTLVRIAADYNENSLHRVSAYVPAWDPKEGVTFPIDFIPEDLRQYLKTNTRFFANVNTGADTQDDLFFDNLEIITEPPPDGIADMLHS